MFYNSKLSPQEKEKYTNISSFGITDFSQDATEKEGLKTSIIK